MPRQFHRERIFSTNGAGTVGQPYVKNTNLNSYLTPGITDRNISPNTRKLLKENIGENLSSLGFGEGLLKKTQKVIFEILYLG